MSLRVGIGVGITSQRWSGGGSPPMPLPMQQRATSASLGSRMDLDCGGMRVRAIISTLAEDRAGDIVVPHGLRNLDQYMQNPVVLWAHNRQIPPIAQCEWIDIQPDRVIAEVRFAQNSAFAEEVFRLYEQRVLRGWSIGFIPRRATRMSYRNLSGRRIESWDLLEFSAVPIPENPGALTLAVEDRSSKCWPSGRDALAQLFPRVPDRAQPDIFNLLVKP